jgi:hypothetical protein
MIHTKQEQLFSNNHAIFQPTRDSKLFFLYTFELPKKSTYLPMFTLRSMFLKKNFF